MPSTRRASLPATLKTCLAFIVELRKKNRGSERRLLTNFRTVFFREVKIAVRTMKIHSGTQHMRIDDKNFLACRTRNFDRLTHRLPHNHFRFGFSLLKNLTKVLALTPSKWFGRLECVAEPLRVRNPPT